MEEIQGGSRLISEVISGSMVSYFLTRWIGAIGDGNAALDHALIAANVVYGVSINAFALATAIETMTTRDWAKLSFFIPAIIYDLNLVKELRRRI